MASFPFMKLYIADYLIDTQHLTTEEHGAYLLLIMNYFNTGKSLPDDDKKLAQICKLGPKRFKKVRANISQFFSRREGQLFHKRIEKEIAEICQTSDSRRYSAKKRWEKEKEKMDANAMQTHMQMHCKSNANGYANAMLIQITDKQIKDINEGSNNINVISAPQQKKDISPSSSLRDDVSVVFECWKEVMVHPEAKLNGKTGKKRIKFIQDALQDYSVRFLCEAIIGCSKTPHNMGDTNGVKYNNIELILRNSSNIERFHNHFVNPPTSKNKASGILGRNQSAIEEVFKQIDESEDVKRLENNYGSQ